MKSPFLPETLKVLVFGDSPMVTSGFGNVVRMAVEGFVANPNFDVYVLGSLDRTPDYEKMRELPYHYWPADANDLGGDNLLRRMCDEVEPDRIFFVGDPGTLMRRARFLLENNIIGPGKHTALISYFPIEGLPIFPSTVNVGRLSAAPLTYCKFGVDALSKWGVTSYKVSHGWDHAPFEEYEESERLHLRNLFAIEDDLLFVGMIGVNKRTNCYPKVFEAMRYIKDNYPEEYEHIIIYIHAQQYDQNALQGYDLRYTGEVYDVADSFLFKPEQDKYKYKMGAYNNPATRSKLLTLDMPSSMEERGELWSQASYITKLNTFDMLLDVASVHGFSLPVLEASMCGVPVATVDDGTARTEIYGDVAYMVTPPKDSYDYWHTGVKLVHVSAEQVGETLVDFYRNKKEYRIKYGQAAKNKFESWTWNHAQEKFNEAVLTGRLTDGQA